MRRCLCHRECRTATIVLDFRYGTYSTLQTVTHYSTHIPNKVNSRGYFLVLCSLFSSFHFLAFCSVLRMAMRARASCDKSWAFFAASRSLTIFSASPSLSSAAALFRIQFRQWSQHPSAIRRFLVSALESIKQKRKHEKSFPRQHVGERGGRQ